jgi:hypothetical protein
MKTMLRFEQAHRDKSVGRMRACFHDDAVIESVASGGLALGPDETIEALHLAFSDSMYLIGDWRYEPLDDDLVLSWTTTRHGEGREHHHETVYRITIGRDGLMWRVGLFRRRADALASVEQHRAQADSADESGWRIAV